LYRKINENHDDFQQVYEKEIKEHMRLTFSSIEDELEKKWIAFDHNFAEINKKLAEHDSTITKGALGLMSGLSKVKTK